jgi:hypothetical protein
VGNYFQAFTYTLLGETGSEFSMRDRNMINQTSYFDTCEVEGDIDNEEVINS